MQIICEQISDGGSPAPQRGCPQQKHCLSIVERAFTIPSETEISRISNKPNSGEEER